MIKAVLDACVLYPASIRDTLLSVASEGIFSPYWSQLIHNEWQRNLLKNRTELTQEMLNHTSNLMNDNFHSAYLNGFHHLIDQMELPDEDDRHVLALAVAVKADYIVTSNLKDFPEAELQKYNTIAISPDKFLSKLLNDFDVLVIEGVKSQRARLKNPSKTADEFIDSLSHSGLTNFSEQLQKIKGEI